MPGELGQNDGCCSPDGEIDYLQISNISHTLAGNEIIDHSDVVGASNCCSNYIFILDLTPGFNGLGKDNCKTRGDIFQFGIWCDLY